MLDRLILGTNSLLGVSHFSRTEARSKLLALSERKMVETIDAALTSGATAINLSPSNRFYRLLEKMKEDNSSHEFGVYLMLPDFERFRDVMLTKGVTGVMQELLSSMNWSERVSAATRGLAALLTSDYSTLLDVYLNLEVQRLDQALPSRAHLRSVLAHEQLTDLAIALDANQILREFVEAVSKKGVMPGFVTRNFPLFVRFLDESGINTDNVVIMTPFNKIGFQMTPDRRACERTLASTGLSKVVAMSILAGGRLDLQGATTYLKTLDGISSVVVGVSSRLHALETFSKLRGVF